MTGARPTTNTSSEPLTTVLSRLMTAPLSVMISHVIGSLKGVAPSIQTTACQLDKYPVCERTADVSDQTRSGEGPVPAMVRRHVEHLY